MDRGQAEAFGEVGLGQRQAVARLVGQPDEPRRTWSSQKRWATRASAERRPSDSTHSRWIAASRLVENQ